MSNFDDVNLGKKLTKTYKKLFKQIDAIGCSELRHKLDGHATDSINALNKALKDNAKNYAVFVHGSCCSPKYSSPGEAEKAIELLSPAHQSIAEIREV